MAIGVYTPITQVITAAAQTEIQNNINRFLNLFFIQTKNTVTGSSLRGNSPDFDEINPATKNTILNEVRAAAAAIAAAPTA